ncbi:cell morphogenesis N-terminal-domain-containing protein [Obelidium mucronatum]|nr:cell morphogenesis N-terminal-domain-containing protein [Obelidium mucronatum]
MFRSTPSLDAPPAAPRSHARAESASAADVSHTSHASRAPQREAASAASAAATAATAAEHALRLLFTRFVEKAEEKVLQQVYAHGGDTNQIDLSVALRPGVDLEFDGILRGLGAIAKHCQKDLIEGLMAWRTDKSNASQNRVPNWVAPLYLLKEMEKIVYNRQMMVSNFILLRAWIEIVQNMTKDMLQDSLATKMEYVAFNQLRYENPELVATNPTCKAHIDLNAEFLGKLSQIRFAKVSDGFVKEISELSKPVTNKDPNLQALKLGICIRAMRFLKLKIYPMDCLEETAEFLMIFANFFVNSHNPKIKHAYCDLFVELLEPVVAVATAEVNLPTWKEGIELIFGKAMRMIAKKGHMQHSLPLVTTALCLSRKEFFIQNLPAVIEICIQRLRDKQLKAQSLVSVDLEFYGAGASKRVESLLKHIFPPRSTIVNPPDVAFDLLTRIVYISMVKYMEPMMETFSMLMLGIDITSGSSTTGMTPPPGSTIVGTIKSEQKSDYSASTGIPDLNGGGGPDTDFFLASANTNAGPKRQIIGMRAFILLLADIEEALESSSSSGGQSISPWSNGFGGGGGSGGGSSFTGSTTARSVVVQGKIKLLSPPFPSLTLSDKGDMVALASIQDRSASNNSNSLAADHGIEASWVSNSSTKSHESASLIAAKAAVLGSAMANSTVQRMSNNVKIYLDRVNLIFGSMLVSLDKACGNHFWRSGQEFGYMNLATGAGNVNSESNNGRRASLGDSGAGGSNLNTATSNSIPTNISGTSVSDSSATSIFGMNKWAHCVPLELQLRRIVEMLGLYTFHTDEHVRTSSIQALMRIGRIIQGISDGGSGGTGVYWSLRGQKFKRGRSLAEATVRVLCDSVQELLLERATDALYYVDFEDSMMEQTAAWAVLKLTEAWVKELTDLKIGELEANDVESSIYDAEYRGLLYLCSTTPAVRRIGAKLLQAAQELERVLKEKCGVSLGGKKDSLLQSALSDIDEEEYLWDRCFPDLAQYFLTYAHPVTLLKCVSVITNRLHFLNSSIIASDFSNQSGGNPQATVSIPSTNISMEPHHVANLSKVFGISAAVINSNSHVPPVSDSVLTQWRVYLKMSCACIEIADMDTFPNTVSVNGAASLKPVVLFRMAVAYLFMERPPIRKSAVISIGGANWRSYRTIFEVLNGYMKTIAVPRKGLNHEAYRKNEAMFKPVLNYVYETTRFLADPEVQLDWDYHLLRYHFCTLIEKFYFHVRVTCSSVYSATGEFSEDPNTAGISKYFPFEIRLNAFALLESWCGYGKQAGPYLEIQSKSMIKALETIVAKDRRDPNKVAETMNKQRATLQLAALKAMASLAHGPMDEPSSRTHFSVGDLHHWINDLYNSQNEEFHQIASVATQGLLMYNWHSEDLMNIVLRECYISSDSSIGGAVGYFTAIVNIYAGPPNENADPEVCRGVHRDYPCAAPRLIALSLFKSGDPDPEIRNNALRLLKAIELRVWPDSEPSLAHSSSPSTADERFLKDANYSSVVSELCLRIEQVSSRDGIRDILSFLVPWIRNLQLASVQQRKSMSKVENPFLEEDADSPLRRTENFLTNLFYITICFGDDFSAEVEAIWIHLLRHTNVKPVNDLYLNPVWPEEVSLPHLNTLVDFILALGVSRRNPHLLSRITPINFTPMDNTTVKIGSSQASVPYCIDINVILRETASRPPLTFGGLLSTFLVELILQAKPETTRLIVPYVIHIVFIQLDHFISLICEQMKSLLIRLLQDLPLNAVDRKEVARIVMKISEKEDRRLWAYEDINPDRLEIESTTHLSRLVLDVLQVFSKTNPQFLEEWTRAALFFAVNCPVRHAACRSLQILRALLDVQSYSLEILTTLHAQIQGLDASQMIHIPQLFWAGVAILSSPLEAEFLKGVEILTSVIAKLDFQSVEVQTSIYSAKPSKWKGGFTGIQPLLIRGLQSKKCEKVCLALLNDLTTIMSDTLIDAGSSRLVCSVLANFPCMMQGFEADPSVNGGNTVEYKLETSLAAASNLSRLSDMMQQPSLSRLMQSYARRRFRTAEDFIQQFAFSMKDIFFPVHEAVILQVLSNLLSNKLPFYQKWSLRLLKIIVPYLAPNSSGEFPALSLIDVEADLIQPCVAALKSDYSELAASVLQELLSGSAATLNDRYLRRNYSKISQESFDRVMVLMETGEASTVENKTGWRFSGDAVRASKVTRYNVASVVSTCGINNISTQIPVLREVALAKPVGRENVGSSVVCYRIPPKPQDKLLLSEENKGKLLKSIQILDDIFKDDDESGFDDTAKIENVTVRISAASENSQHNNEPRALHSGGTLVPDYTAFKHLLSQSNVGVQVVIRVQLPYESATSSENFSRQLAADITSALITEEGAVMVDQIVDARQDDANAKGTLVTVDLTGGGLLGDGKIAAAQAEELKALIMKQEDLVERSVLWSGTVAAYIDATFEPKIFINFKGMTIPYFEEGLRSLLPHRQHLSLDPPALTTDAAEPDASFVPRQLHADLVALVDDLNANSGDHDLVRQVSERLLLAVLTVRNNSQGYCPSLLRVASDSQGVVSVVVDEDALTVAARRLMNLDSARLTAFLAKREHHVQSINSQISSYLNARRRIGGDFANTPMTLDSVKSVISLAISLMTLHGIILALEGVYDDYIHGPDVRRFIVSFFFI